MSSARKLWLGLAALLVVSFSLLLWAGGEIFRAAPPIPEHVLSADGGTLGYAQLNPEQQAGLRGRLQQMFRKNLYDAATGTSTLSVRPNREPALLPTTA